MMCVGTCLSCRLDACWLPHHGAPRFGEGDVRYEAYANYWSLGSCPWARTQSTAARMGVSSSYHRGHLQPLVCLCSWEGAGDSQASGPSGSEVTVSGGKDKRVSEERCSTEGLEGVDCSGDIPAGNWEKQVYWHSQWSLYQKNVCSLVAVAVMSCVCLQPEFMLGPESTSEVYDRVSNASVSWKPSFARFGLSHSGRGLSAIYKSFSLGQKQELLLVTQHGKRTKNLGTAL